MARCPDCGASVPADGDHACPGLRPTKIDSPSGRSGERPGPSGGRVTVQVADAEPLPLPPPADLDAAVSAAAVASDEDFDPRIGTLLGEHYRILERLGAGGMGTVYLVVHVHLKKKFAAKILNPDTARRPDALARFQQEAVSASRLDQENIVDVVNFGVSEDGTVYLIMEFLKGETLNQILYKGPLPFDDVVRVAVPVCRGLAAAHNAGIVHRDMKPENIFVARKSGGRHVIKLLDFGVSKIKETAFAERRLTQTGDVLGSPLYMSPEASKGEGEIDGRADIYAVGVMLFEMCTGTVPFTAMNYLQVLYKHIQEAPPAPRTIRSDLPEALEAVILRAMAKDPAARFQRMDELEAALLVAVPGVDLDAPISKASPASQTSVDSPISESPPVEPPRRSGPRRAEPEGTPPTPFGAMRTTAPPPVVPTTTRVVPTRSRAGFVAGFIGTLALLAVAAVLLLRDETPEPVAPAVRAVPVPIAVQPLPPRPPPPPPPASVPAPVQAEISVESDPPGAAVWLDGQPVGATPLTTRLAADAREHTVKLELAGYRTEQRQVVADKNRALAIALRRAREKPHTMDIKEGR
jgi:serine/threonine-protein kinase